MILIFGPGDYYEGFNSLSPLVPILNGEWASFKNTYLLPGKTRDPYAWLKPSPQNVPLRVCATERVSVSKCIFWGVFGDVSDLYGELSRWRDDENACDSNATRPEQQALQNGQEESSSLTYKQAKPSQFLLIPSPTPLFTLPLPPPPPLSPYPLSVPLLTCASGSAGTDILAHESHRDCAGLNWRGAHIA